MCNLDNWSKKVNTNNPFFVLLRLFEQTINYTHACKSLHLNLYFSNGESRCSLLIFCVIFQQVRAAFEILTLLLAFLYIVILIRQMISQEKLKTVLFDLVRLLCVRVFNKINNPVSVLQTLGEKETLSINYHVNPFLSWCYGSYHFVKLVLMISWCYVSYNFLNCC